MRDRIPTKPNRYAVYDDNHNFIRYEYHERADEPTQTGDALNKANLLPDTVATALGLTGNPQVAEALNKIKTLIDANTTLANSKAQIVTGSYTGTGTYGSGSKNSITLDAAPKLFAILFYTEPGTNPLIQTTLALFNVGKNGTISYNLGANQFNLSGVAWSNGNKTVSWYGSTAQQQLNVNGYSYTFVYAF